MCVCVCVCVQEIKWSWSVGQSIGRDYANCMLCLEELSCHKEKGVSCVLFKVWRFGEFRGPLYCSYFHVYENPKT